MPPSTLTRRSVLRLLGSAAAVVPATRGVVADAGTDANADAGANAESFFTPVETPVDADLYDLERTVDGAYVVGSGGRVFAVDDDGLGGHEEWRTAVRAGPAGDGRTLRVAATGRDHRDLWFAGENGSLGRYDVAAGSTADCSAPDDETNDFTDLAVCGRGSGAAVFLTDTSGHLHYSFDRAATWHHATPGRGTRLTAVDFHCPHVGHAVDDAGTVFELHRPHPGDGRRGGDGDGRRGGDRGDGRGTHRDDDGGHGRRGASGRGGHHPVGNRLTVERVPDAGVDAALTAVTSHGCLLDSCPCPGQCCADGGVTVAGADGSITSITSGEGRRTRSPVDAALRGVRAYEWRGVYGVAFGDGGALVAFYFPGGGVGADASLPTTPTTRRFDRPVSTLRGHGYGQTGYLVGDGGSVLEVR